MTHERRQIAGALAASVVIGGLAWLVGVTVMGSVLIGLVVAALMPVLANPVESTMVLPPLAPRLRHGARVEVSRLSWAMAGRRGRVDARVVRRLRTTAYRRLADLHLDPGQTTQAEAAERALGPWAYSVVVGDRTELSRDEVIRLVAAIEGLGAARQGGVPSRQRGPAGTEQ
jgi:hypothetical protein